MSYDTDAEFDALTIYYSNPTDTEENKTNNLLKIWKEKDN